MPQLSGNEPILGLNTICQRRNKIFDRYDGEGISSQVTDTLAKK